jgi:hypothetical protein
VAKSLASIFQVKLSISQIRFLISLMLNQMELLVLHQFNLLRQSSENDQEQMSTSYRLKETRSTAVSVIYMMPKASSLIINSPRK